MCNGNVPINLKAGQMGSLSAYYTTCKITEIFGYSIAFMYLCNNVKTCLKLLRMM